MTCLWWCWSGIIIACIGWWWSVVQWVVMVCRAWEHNSIKCLCHCYTHNGKWLCHCHPSQWHGIKWHQVTMPLLTPHNDIKWHICHCHPSQLLLLLLKKVDSARLSDSDVHPISPKTPALQYQPIDRKKRKGKKVEDYSRDRAA